MKKVEPYRKEKKIRTEDKKKRRKERIKSEVERIIS